MMVAFPERNTDMSKLQIKRYFSNMLEFVFVLIPVSIFSTSITYVMFFGSMMLFSPEPLAEAMVGIVIAFIVNIFMIVVLYFMQKKHPIFKKIIFVSAGVFFLIGVLYFLFIASPADQLG